MESEPKMNQETRSWEELAAENKDLHEQLDQARITIAGYQQAHAVAEAMDKNNDVLRSVESSTYQVHRPTLPKPPTPDES